MPTSMNHAAAIALAAAFLAAGCGTTEQAAHPTATDSTAAASATTSVPPVNDEPQKVIDIPGTYSPILNVDLPDGSKGTAAHIDRAGDLEDTELWDVPLPFSEFVVYMKGYLNPWHSPLDGLPWGDGIDEDLTSDWGWGNPEGNRHLLVRLGKMDGKRCNLWVRNEFQ